jgi:hypothetical protein
MTLPADIDQLLWIRTLVCEGPDYLFGNPHTFPGRMSAYCPHHQTDYSVSRSEIVDCSTEARWWVVGFLVGNEPPPPRDPDGEYVPTTDRRYRRWLDAARRFHEKGDWPRDVPTASQDESDDASR